MFKVQRIVPCLRTSWFELNIEKQAARGIYRCETQFSLLLFHSEFYICLCQGLPPLSLHQTCRQIDSRVIARMLSDQRINLSTVQLDDKT